MNKHYLGGGKYVNVLKCVDWKSLVSLHSHRILSLNAQNSLNKSPCSEQFHTVVPSVFQCL